MPDATLPLYVLLREAGLSGLFVDLLPGNGGAGRSAPEEGSPRPLLVSPDAEEEPTLCAIGSALPVRDGCADAVLCGGRDLAGGDSAEALAAEARRALVPDGVLAVVARSPELAPELAEHGVGAAAPAELESRLRRHFPHITTYAQAPIRGYELGRVGTRTAPSGEVRLEGGDELPTHHLLLASRRHRRWPETLDLRVPAAPPEEATRTMLDRLETSVTVARGEVTRRTEALARLAEETARLRSEVIATEARRDELELLVSQAEKRAALAEEHQQHASRAEARAQAFEARLERLAQQLLEAQESLGLAEVRLHEAEARAVRAETEKAALDAAVSRAAEAIRRVDDLSEEVASLTAETRRARETASEAEARADAAEAAQQEAGRWARDAEQRLDAAQSALEKLAAERRGWAAERAIMEEQLDSAQAGADTAARTVMVLEERGITTERDAAQHAGERGGLLLRLAELEAGNVQLKAEVERLRLSGPGADPEPKEDAAQHRERAAELELELERERRSRAAEIDNLRLHAEARLAQAWELGERLDKSTRQLERLRQQLDEARTTRHEEAAWAMVIPEHALPPEILPELISVIHQGRKLRSLLARLAAVAVAPPAGADPDADD